MAQGLPHFAGRSKARTWAFTIATRVAADYFRRPEHKLKIVEVDQAEDMADLSSSTDERFITDEMNSCVRQVIDSLPADYRSASAKLRFLS